MKASRAVSAFTLIELLVVVAIIALLIAILLPSLASAREQARTAACGANERGIGQGLAGYTTEWDRRIPGPNTSGYQMSWVPAASYVPQNLPTEPVQNLDWISPILGRALSLPTSMGDRYFSIFNSKLRCPSNSEKYQGEYPSFKGGNVVVTQNGTPIASPSVLNMISYSAVLGFQVRDVTQATTAGTGDKVTEQYSSLSAMRSAVSVTPGFQFRVDQVGLESGKVFAMEGTRFVDSTMNFLTTYNTLFLQYQGGTFMVIGPPVYVNGDPYIVDPTGQPTPIGKRYAYRHNGKLNMIFFDGHVESRTGPQSMDTKLYFPKGSVVGTGSPYDKSTPSGMVLP